MKIAIDTRSLLNNGSGAYGFFLSETLKKITRIHTEAEFLLFFDRPCPADFAIENNTRVVVTGPAATNPFRLKLWYELRLPELLKKLQVDMLVAGPGICSLVTRIPQCMVINDLAFLCSPSYVKKTQLFFLKRYTKRYVQKADRIVASSAFIENELMRHYAVKKEKISVIRGAAKPFRQVTGTEKDEMRNEYTGGKNYFLYAGEIDQRKNLVSLLKAFSVFKRRQKSDWKLVLAGNIASQYKSFRENIKSYKYRDDLVVVDRPVEQITIRLIASAWALVYPASCEGSGDSVFDALQNGVPVITAENSAISEIAADAALLFNPGDYKSIADKMMSLYKDEAMRGKLIERGKAILMEYTWDKTASLFWQAILQTGDPENG